MRGVGEIRMNSQAQQTPIPIIVHIVAQVSDQLGLTLGRLVSKIVIIINTATFFSDECLHRPTGFGCKADRGRTNMTTD